MRTGGGIHAATLAERLVRIRKEFEEKIIMISPASNARQKWSFQVALFALAASSKLL